MSPDALRGLFAMPVYHLALRALCSLCVATFCALSFASPVEVHFTTTVFDEAGQALRDARIRIGNNEYMADTEGSVSATTARATHYAVYFEAPAHYPMVHTFSEGERRAHGGRLPPVTLVARAPGRRLLAFAGDLMMGRRFHKPLPGDARVISANNRLADSRQLLAPMRPYLELADLASVNLESVVTAKEPTEVAAKSFVFFSYPETLDAISRAGIDYVSLGNNHTYDYLAPALGETLRWLGDSTLGFSGAGLTEAEALRPWMTEVDNIPYALHGFVGWKGRGVPHQVAEGNKGGAALISPENLVRALAAAPESAVNVIQVHGGSEYSFAPPEYHRARLRRAAEAGADLVIGHHPHVLQGFELFDGKLIAYSLGNFVFDQAFYLTQRSALLYVWMDRDRFHRAEIVPLHIRRYRPTPATGAVRDSVLRRLAEQSRPQNVTIGSSGGHGTITRNSEPGPGPGVRTPPTPETFSIYRPAAEIRRPITVPRDCRAGQEQWVIGDFESDGRYKVRDNDWTVFNAAHRIDYDEAANNRALVFRERQRNLPVSIRQKHFLHRWETGPTSFALSVMTPMATEVKLCLELHTRKMSIAEARLRPVDRCVGSQNLTGGDSWEQLVFDFDAPESESARGVRFRTEFRNLEEANAPVERAIDDVMVVSWEHPAEDRRLNVLRCDNR